MVYREVETRTPAPGTAGIDTPTAALFTAQSKCKFTGTLGKRTQTNQFG